MSRGKSGRSGISWRHRLWAVLLGGRERALEISGRRYEYFVLAALAWCCCGDESAGLAAIATAGSTSVDGREMMIKYLNLVSEVLDLEQREKIANLITGVRGAADHREMSLTRKLRLSRGLRNADPEYYVAWKRMLAEPGVFCRRHPEITEFRQGLPQWLRDAMYGCARVCPNCGLTNAASTEACACGQPLTARDCPNFR